MARERRNKPRERLARPKKKGLRERRQQHRQLREAAIALIAKHANLSSDGVAAGHETVSDWDGETRRYTRARCTAEGMLTAYGRWVPPVPPFPITVAAEDAGHTLDGCLGGPRYEPREPQLTGGREGYWAGRVVKRWKKLKQRELEALLSYEWEPERPKSAVDALGDLARGRA